VPVGSVELVTQSEYARRRGCSEAAVRRAVKDGRISLLAGKLDPTAADAQWARNTRVRAGSKPADSANLGAPGGAAAAGEGAAPTREDNDAYWAVKARREKAEADMAELKLAEQTGELVRRAEVEAIHSRHAALFREALLQMSTRITPIIAGYGGDEAKIRALIDQEHRQALTQFAGGTDGRA
jgi:hypothetical protein